MKERGKKEGRKGEEERSVKDEKGSLTPTHRVFFAALLGHLSNLVRFMVVSYPLQQTMWCVCRACVFYLLIPSAWHKSWL